MRYLLPCECGRKNPVATTQAGDTLTCECGRSLPVPKLRDLRQLEAVSEQAPRSGLKWSRAQGVMFSLGAVMVLLAGTVMVFTTLQRRTLNTEKPEILQEPLNEYLAQIDRNTPLENLEVWRTEVLEQGLRREEPEYLTHRRIAQMLWTIALVASVFGVIGLAMIVASFVWRPAGK
jgi:hypothetical protein